MVQKLEMSSIIICVVLKHSNVGSENILNVLRGVNSEDSDMNWTHHCPTFTHEDSGTEEKHITDTWPELALMSTRLTLMQTFWRTKKMCLPVLQGVTWSHFRNISCEATALQFSLKLWWNRRLYCEGWKSIPPSDCPSVSLLIVAGQSVCDIHTPPMYNQPQHDNVYTDTFHYAPHLLYSLNLK